MGGTPRSPVRGRPGATDGKRTPAARRAAQPSTRSRRYSDGSRPPRASGYRCRLPSGRSARSCGSDEATKHDFVPKRLASQLFRCAFPVFESSSGPTRGRAVSERKSSRIEISAPRSRVRRGPKAHRIRNAHVFSHAKPRETRWKIGVLTWTAFSFARGAGTRATADARAHGTTRGRISKRERRNKARSTPALEDTARLVRSDARCGDG